ncbi:hypothetical protein WI560_32030 [Bradyrhizobium sp. A11]|uniref:hypothetical protein n=1 Tax=Bradyrhizobium sp. A11 TaxID=3133974 RepID=UPI00324958F9
MDDDQDFGGISSEEIADFVRSLAAPPSEAGATPTARFSRHVSNLIFVRAAYGESKTFSVFLRSEALADDVTRCECVEFPLLKNGSDPVAGRIWISTASLTTTFEAKLAWSDQTSLFQAIRDAGLGAMPALVVDWRTGAPIGTLYREGLSNATQSEQVIFAELPISPVDLKGVLDRFYDRSLRTPALVVEGHAMRIWSEANKGIPEPRPEERIQGRLSDFLKSAFPRYDVRSETQTADGRADIIVYRKDTTAGNLPATVTHWVLELKALCDMTSTGNAVPMANVPTAISDGLDQAIAYKSRLNAVNAALCCFDMQKEEEDEKSLFGHIDEDAKNANIHLWRWYLYRHTKASRKQNIKSGSI